MLLTELRKVYNWHSSLPHLIYFKHTNARIYSLKLSKLHLAEIKNIDPIRSTLTYYHMRTDEHLLACHPTITPSCKHVYLFLSFSFLLLSYAITAYTQLPQISLWKTHIFSNFQLYIYHIQYRLLLVSLCSYTCSHCYSHIRWMYT